MPTLSGLAQPAPIGSANIPPEILTGMLTAAEKIDGMFDSFAQVTPDLAADWDLCKEIAKQVPFCFSMAETGTDPDKRDYIVSNARIEATRPAYATRVVAKEWQDRVQAVMQRKLYRSLLMRDVEGVLSERGSGFSVFLVSFHDHSFQSTLNRIE
jgi:hypothetical protein